MKKVIFGLVLGALFAVSLPAEACTMRGCGVGGGYDYGGYYNQPLQGWGGYYSPSYNSYPSYNQYSYYPQYNSYPSYPSYPMQQQYSYAPATSYAYSGGSYPFINYMQPYWGW